MKNITGDWINDGDCMLKEAEKGCGEGTQKLTRECIDGNIDTCTDEDRHNETSCYVDCPDSGNNYFHLINTLCTNQDKK